MPQACLDCDTPLPITRGRRLRWRCAACTLRHWRAKHPEKKRAQDQRYRERDPDYVRTLVRARVARYRARLRRAAKKKKEKK